MICFFISWSILKFFLFMEKHHDTTENDANVKALWNSFQNL